MPRLGPGAIGHGFWGPDLSPADGVSAPPLFYPIQTGAPFVGDGTASTFPTTFALNVTAGNAIVVCTTTPSSIAVTGVTDSLGNSYAQCGTGFTDAGVINQVWIALNIAGGACTVTVATGSNSECAGTVSEVYGLVTSNVVDATNGAAGTSAMATLALTTTTASVVLIGCMSHVSAAVSLASGPDFLILGESELAAHMPMHSEYRAVDATGSWTVNVVLGGSVNWKIYAVALKLATGAVASLPYKWLQPLSIPRREPLALVGY